MTPDLLPVLLTLWGVACFGSIIPVIPTGAAVSSAAVLAGNDHAWEIGVVVVVAASAAYVGDLVTYAVLRVAGEGLATRVGWLHADDPGGRLAQLRETIESRERRTLLLSRLVPGGRIPVLLVTALAGFPFRRFAAAAVFSTLAWAALYAAIGVVGTAVFPDTTTAIVVAAVVSVLVSVLPGRLRPRRASAR